ARLHVDGARLPDLELVEGAEDDVTRRRRGRGPRLLPVSECLLAVRRKPVDLARTLHFHDADAGPEEIHESVRAVLLETRSNGLAVNPVTGKQLVQKRLRLRALRAVIAAPAHGELPHAPAAHLLAGRHQVRESAAPSRST